MKRFVICPGHVISQSDGDRHFISAGQLMRLYKVNMKECIVLRDDGSKPPGYRPDHDWSRYIFLKPRYHGDYAEYLTEKLNEKGWEL
jgi:hypothetical protein